MRSCSKEPPERIVAFDSAAVEILFAIGRRRSDRRYARLRIVSA